jgi:hypothetical protein
MAKALNPESLNQSYNLAFDETITLENLLKLTVILSQ